MLCIAPLQGHTDAPWRHFHAIRYGGRCTYFAPFARLEHGNIRPRDLRDFTSTLNEGIDFVPQVIFRDMAELRTLVEALAAAGANRINLNIGCPFALQNSRGRGAALLATPERLDGLADLAASLPHISFSVKMRLGYDSPTQWRRAINAINRMRPAFIAVHPRTARQQYSGDLHMDEFEALLHSTDSPVIFNGELHTPAHIADIVARYPSLGGVMCGRGIVGRPSLFAEYSAGAELPQPERIHRMKLFHADLLRHYTETLCGPAQLLSHMRTFWEYSESEIGHKSLKQIRKASTLPKYLAAVEALG